MSVSPKRSNHKSSSYHRLNMKKGRQRQGGAIVLGGSKPEATRAVRATATAASHAQAATDVEELGYLLSCARVNRRRGGESSQNNQNNLQQLKALLDGAVRQAFTASSCANSPVVSALKSRWLSATALLFNSPKNKAWMTRDPILLARTVHRAFHSREQDDKGGGVASSSKGGGRILGAHSAVAATVAASSSSRSPRPSAAPMGTLESTVLGGGRTGSLSPSSSFELDGHHVSGTDTATSSSSDEGEDGSLGLISAQDLVSFAGCASADPSTLRLLLQRRLYRRFVEALHLELVGRSPSVLGGRIFHVYPLTGPVRSLLNLHDLRKQIENEFRLLQGGGAGGTHRRVAVRRMGQQFRAARECRVYACRPPKSKTSLWIQINLGSPPHGPASQKSKKPHAPASAQLVGASRRCPAAATLNFVTEPESTVMYHILLQEGGMHVAMASSGPTQRQSSPSNSKEQASTAQWILAALDSAVTAAAAASSSTLTTKTTTRKSKMRVYRRIEALSGPDPLDLLRSSTSMTDRTALGRFRMYDSKLQHRDGELLTNFEGTSFAATNKLPTTSPGAISRLGTSGALLQHSVGKQLDRKRSHVQHFGRPEDCPKRLRIRWDVDRHDSIAAATAVLATTGLPGTLLTEMPSLPTTYVKCRVVLQGLDVIAGLRALVESGDLGGNAGVVGSGKHHHLPSCVRDAPISSYETIKVVNGDVALL